MKPVQDMQLVPAESDLPRLKPDQELNVCVYGCGAFQVVKRDTGDAQWVCPACELATLDAYFDAKERLQAGGRS